VGSLVSGVAEGLDVQADDVGVVVALPVAEQVVDRHVGAVAEGHEARQTDAHLVRLGSDGRAHHPGLRQERHPTRAAGHPGEGGVQAHLGVVVDDAEAVGPDQPDAPGAGDVEDLGLERLSLGAGLGEPGRENDHAVDLLSGALFDHSGDVLSRHHHHGQVDRLLDVEDAAHRRGGAHVLHVRVDRPHRPLEPAPLQVREELLAEAGRSVAGPDHRHRPGRQQATDGLRSRSAGSLFDGGEALGGGHDAEAHLDEAVREARAGLEPGRGEHADHLAVLGQHRCREPGDADLASADREVLEQHRGKAPAVVGVVHEERHLGLGQVPPPVVPGDADHLVAPESDEGHAVLEVDGGEPLDLLVRQARPGAEVAVVDALRGLAGVERHQPLRVVGSDRAHVGGGPI
jgi:hypothetical protein